MTFEPLFRVVAYVDNLRCDMCERRISYGNRYVVQVGDSEVAHPYHVACAVKIIEEQERIAERERQEYSTAWARLLRGDPPV